MFLENCFIDNVLGRTNVNTFKIFLILNRHADDIAIFANISVEKQQDVNCLFDYCDIWNLMVNTV
jgi:hypothetical protein